MSEDKHIEFMYTLKKYINEKYLYRSIVAKISKLQLKSSKRVVYVDIC